MRITDAIDSTFWAMDEEWLRTLRSIALGEGEGAEAVAARLGRPLQNTQTVTNRDGVAIVPVAGPIFRYANLFTQVSGATSVEIFARDFRAALDDPNVRAIVLEINSPGGQVDGVNEAARMIFEARTVKPVVAYISWLGTSAAYWLAAAASEVVVEATAIVGQIGAVLAVSRDDKDEGVIEFVSAQSPNKRPDLSTDAGRAQIQATVDAIGEVFVGTVAEFRGVDRETVLRDFGAGGVRVGAQAIVAGLADRQGSLERTIAQLTTGYRPKGRIKMSAGADKPKVTTEADKPKVTTEMVEPDSEGNCPDGYTKGDDGMCHLMPTESAARLAEARAAGFKAGREEGFAAGATAERARILGIEQYAIEGCEDLVAEMKRDGQTTPDAAASRIMLALKAKPAKERDDALAALRATDQRVDPAPTPTGADPVPVSADGVVDEITARRQWDQNPKLRSEYADFKDFFAFKKHERGVKVIDKRVG